MIPVVNMPTTAHPTAWFVTRDHSLAVWDEYVPCDSWTACIDLISSKCWWPGRTYLGVQPLPDTYKLRLHIYGKRRRDGQLRPHRFTGTVEHGTICVPVLFVNSTKAQTLRVALRKALRDPGTRAALKRCLHDSYDPALVSCVYHLEVRPDATSAWVPWLSQYPAHDDPAGWEPGAYVQVPPPPRMPRRYNVYGSGYGGHPMTPEEAARFSWWVEHP